MIILFIILLCFLPDILRAEDRRQAAEDLQRRQAEKAAAAAARQAETIRRRAEADRKRAEAEERRRAAARTMIEFYEPRRRDLLQLLERERDARRRFQLEERIFQIERKLEAAYWTLEDRD